MEIIIKKEDWSDWFAISLPLLIACGAIFILKLYFFKTTHLLHIVLTILILVHYKWNKRSLTFSVGKCGNIFKSLTDLGVFSLFFLPFHFLCLSIFQPGTFSLNKLMSVPFTASMIAVDVFYAFVEEWYFRGFAYDVFNQRSQWQTKFLGLPVNYAVIASTVLFTVCHIPYRITAFAVTTGFMLGVLRERTGNIIVPTIFHAFCNQIAFAVYYVYAGG